MAAILLTLVSRFAADIIQTKYLEFQNKISDRTTTLRYTHIASHVKFLLHNDVSVNDGPHIRRWSHNITIYYNTGLFISPSGISELDRATTKTDTAERSISIGRESLQVFFFVLGALAYFQVLLLGGSREEKWRSQ